MTPRDESPAPPRARLPLDGGGARAAGGGGARAGDEERASRGNAGNACGPNPLSRAARDSSPIEGERGAWLKARAKAMRKEMTPHEKIVWRTLHEGELAALNWRRQVAFGDYVLDFVSHAARLVVEVDGGQHSLASQAAHDAERTAWLQNQGYRVMRFWNPETLQQSNGVWLTIQAAAMETPAKARMQRWREKHAVAVREINSRLTEHGARLPLDGGGARAAGGGGARAGGEEGASRGNAGNAGGPHPLSRAARDSSPIEGERGSSFGESE